MVKRRLFALLPGGISDLRTAAIGNVSRGTINKDQTVSVSALAPKPNSDWNEYGKAQLAF